MNVQKHTPELWVFTEAYSNGYNGTYVSVAAPSEHGPIKNEADALLIAAAPELLESCKVALGCLLILQEKHPELWEVNNRTWNTAKLSDTLGATIIKATGGVS